MNLSVGTNIHGFEVTQIREIPQLNGRLVEMRHEISGAELCWLDNRASNKLFSVAFKTLPYDDTGVFHILEHSVLCGSEKFPVKEPFVDLLKGSMQTFLNAMTYPDKTVYPISSRNKQDYLNLAEVYLDAVFAPKILTNPYIFMQEGWHLEFDENGSPLFKGVVFNEMKGALSDVDEVIDVGMNRLLFPDNCYYFVSGGEPSVIPELTYEKFYETWNKFYHPSNARFYLDGNVPLDDILSMINGYISGKGKLDKLPVLNYQKPASKSSEIAYELGDNESTERKTHLSMSKIIGTYADKTKTMAASIIADYLAESNESPLTKVILDSKLAQDVIVNAVDGIAQPIFSINVKNLEKSDIPKIKETIAAKISEIAEKGIDKAELYACINQMEFKMRSIDEPQGLIRNINALDSWLYGGDPLLYLVDDDNFAELREMVENGGFDKLITELFSPDGMCEVIAVPDKELGRKKNDAENAELKKRAAKLSGNEKAEHEKQLKALVEWQSAPDSAESKAKLPKLSISEISDKPEKIDTTVNIIDGVKIIHHKIASSGIIHFTLYFTISQLKLEEISKLTLLDSLIGTLPTSKHTSAELQQLTRNYIGSMNVRIKSYAEKGDRKRCMPMISVSVSALEKNAAQAIELVCEMITETDFSQKEMIKNAILQTEESNRQQLISSGHAVGINEVRSGFSANSAVEEAVSGLSRIKCISTLSEKYDEIFEDYSALLKNALAQSVCKKRLTISITSDSDIDILSQLNIPEGTYIEPYAEYASDISNKLGINMPTPIAYAVSGWYAPSRKGEMRVAAQIMTYDYLWSEVRVHGGAYGTGMKCFRNGDTIFYSYRDPSPAKSLSIFSIVADALEKWCDSDDMLENYIISSIAASEPLRTPKTEGIIQDEYTFTGVSFEERTAERHEMLNTTKESLRKLCTEFRKISKNERICVVTNQQLLESISDINIV